ncbi:MAG: LacI family DNA-binding transcriptional regulator [Clostridia bacterium]|nr:LacI family DNA-binding transcriptional regulator [Clostridia bacterium]
MIYLFHKAYGVGTLCWHSTFSKEDYSICGSISLLQNYTLPQKTKMSPTAYRGREEDILLFVIKYTIDKEIYELTIKELAHKCSVSTATISRAFDTNSVMKEETRQKILNAAKEYQYSPNLIARGLKRNQTNTIGFIIPSVDNLFYIDILKYIEIELKKYGYRMLISFVQDGVQTEDEALSVMLASQVDALIMVPTGAVDSQKIAEIGQKIYLIQLFGGHYDFLDCVYMDDKQGVKNALDYLLKNGHQKILYVSEAPNYDIYKEAYSENGLSADCEYILKPYSSVDDIAKQICRLHPTAVLGIALHAEQAWLALKKCGMKIPDDVSFIAYDDVKWVQMFDITAVAHNYEEIAGHAVDLLIRNLKEKQPKVEHIKLMPYMIERGSVINQNLRQHTT